MPKIPRDSPRAELYIKHYNVVEKIRKAKIEEYSAALSAGYWSGGSPSGEPRSPVRKTVVAGGKAKAASAMRTGSPARSDARPSGSKAGASSESLSARKGSRSTKRQQAQDRFKIENSRANKGKRRFTSKSYLENLELIRSYCARAG